MFAVLLRQFGDPSVLKIEEVATPAPNPKQVLVVVKAAGINPGDVKNVAGTMYGTTLPRIPGRDFAGIVLQGPPELVGTEVFGTGGDIGFTLDGTHAEGILLPASAVAPKPESLSLEAAGSAGVKYVTAWSALVTAAQVAGGDVTVIIGAAGGVGAAATQVAKAKRARVIAVVRKDSDIPAAKANGAAEVLNSSSQNIVESVLALTGNRGADVILDTTGNFFADSIEMAAHHCRIPVIAAPPESTVSVNLRNLFRKVIRVAGVDSRKLDSQACALLLAQMRPYFDSRQFRPTPGQTFPLSAAVEAYETAAQGHTGVILLPSK